MSENQFAAVTVDTTQEILLDGSDRNEMSLQGLMFIAQTEWQKKLENKITAEFVELKGRQDKVSFLKKLVKTINMATVDDQLDCTKNEELKSLLMKAKEYDVQIKDGKFKFNKQEREALIENVKVTADDFNVLNDMQIQAVSRLTNERNESFSIARMIFKTLHETSMSVIRQIKQ